MAGQQEEGQHCRGCRGETAALRNDLEGTGVRFLRFAARSPEQ